MRIGLDIGSSSTKSLLVDERGEARGVVRVRFPTRRAPGGRVEHDAAALLRSTLLSLQGAARQIPGNGVIPLGFAAQRSTMLFWDRDTGRPVTPAYSWQDLRAAAAFGRLASRHPVLRGEDRYIRELVAERTGLRMSAHYAAAKLAWALRHVRGLRRRVHAGRVLWGTLVTYVAWHLTEGAFYAVDHANAQRTLLLDLHSLAWDPFLFELFGLEDLLDVPALPALVPTRFGSGVEVRAGGRRLRLAAMTGDQQAALQGLRCRREHDMAINYGSGAFVLMQIGKSPARVQGLLTTLVDSRHAETEEAGGPAGCVASFALEGTVNAAATALDWLGRRLGRRVKTAGLDRLLGPYDPCAPRTVHFLPAVSGLGAPGWDERARPKFAGEVRGATQRDLVAAAVEAIAQRCAEIAFAAESYRTRGRAAGNEKRLKPGSIAVRVSGGLTRCLYLLQAQADLLQRPVLVTGTRDATALGAALMAGGPPREQARTSAAQKTSAKKTSRKQAVETIVLPMADPSRAAAQRRAWREAVYGRVAGGVAGVDGVARPSGARR